MYFFHTVLFTIALTFLSLQSFANDTPPDRDFTGFESLDESQPLWELGIGGFSTEVPNYPSSSERNFVALASPYVVYRGKVFRAGDGRGARAVLAESKDLELDFSFGGAFSADSDDNTAREGMPELDFLFEAGPQLIYRVKDFRFANGGAARLNMRAQVRSVFSTDFSSIDHRGYIFEPRLSYQQRGRFHPDTGLNASVGVIFATEKLHDYFFEVSPDFATADRPFFDARSGYLATEFSFSFSFPILENLRGVAGAQMQLLSGSANEDSPLFEDDVTFSAAAGFIWRIWESDAKAIW